MVSRVIKIDDDAFSRWSDADPPRPDTSNFVRHTYPLNRGFFSADEDEPTVTETSVKLAFPPDANVLHRPRDEYSLEPIEVLCVPPFVMISVEVDGSK